MADQILPWVEKYRPKTLDAVISHKNAIDSLRLFVLNNCMPNLLLYGPPGTGKTSAALTCARELYGDSIRYMMMELNASDDRGINIVRTKIKTFVSSNNLMCHANKFKLVILDETDAMTGDAQAILRKIIDKYINNARFILICNYIQNINPALKSRCAQLRFPSLPIEDVVIKIREVSCAENFTIDDKAIAILYNITNGDMRKIINHLQSFIMIKMIKKNITYDDLVDVLSYPTISIINEIVKIIMENSFKDSFYKIQEIKNEYSLQLMDLIKTFHEHIFNYIVTSKTDIVELCNINSDKFINIFDELKSIEYNNSTIGNDIIQLSAFIGILFKLFKL